MNNTKIEWCDSTWNPVTGCLNKCEYCYARKIANRFDGHFNPTFHGERLDMPFKTKSPKTIFVGSMCDLFGEWVTDGWIQAVFTVCKVASQHNYLFLTKNPIRYEKYSRVYELPNKSNFWYGMTLNKNKDNQKLLDLIFSPTNELRRFVSIEPLQEQLDETTLHNINFMNWVIIGAETGNRKEKVIPKSEWIAQIVSACDEFNIPVFMKDSLVSIVGEENMRREFPKGLKGLR